MNNPSMAILTERRYMGTVELYPNKNAVNYLRHALRNNWSVYIGDSDCPVISLGEDGTIYFADTSYLNVRDYDSFIERANILVSSIPMELGEF